MKSPVSTRSAAVGGGAFLAVGVAFALTVGGVSVPLVGIQDLPLPGGADLGDHPYEVTAEMRDVLSLVPQSSVKVNDVPVGRVSRIELAEDGWTARVTLRINGDVRLPADAGARVEQSSLLGEKYVQLVTSGEEATGGTGKGGTGKGGAGKGGSGSAGTVATASAGKAAPGGRLKDGAAIPLSRTGRNTEVEEVFGALSLLLNGGGVNQLKTITSELDKALGGREPEIRSMLKQVDTLVTDLDKHRGDITAALDGMNKLSARLAGRKQEIGKVLTDLSPGLKTLEKQRGSLMTMLRSLDTLSDVATDTVDRSKEDMVADLKALAPTLRNLADAGQDLPDSLQVLLTYPFTDEVLRGVKGDYLNVYLDMTAVPGTTVIPPVLAEEVPDGGKARRGSGPSIPESASSSASPGSSAPASPGESSSPLPLPSVPAPGGSSASAGASAPHSPSATSSATGGER